MDRYAGLPPLPDRLGRLRELALDLWWSWNPDARQVFRSLDYPLWRKTAHNPVHDAADRAARRRSSRLRAIRDSLARYDRAIAAARRGARTRSNTWWSAHVPRDRRSTRSRTSPPSSRCTSRCRSTPAASACSRAITARKPATSACRSSASASCTRRATSTSSITADGWQEESYEKLNWDRRANRAGDDGRRSAVLTPVPLGDRSVLVAVWRVRLGRVKLYLLDTDLEENAPWDRAAVGPALRRRSRDARPAGNRPRHRRRARAASARDRPGRLSPERRPRRVRRAAADPRSDRSADGASTRRSPRCADDGLHDAHAGAGRATMRSRSTSSKSTSPARWGPLGAHREPVPRARRLRQRRAARSST